MKKSLILLIYSFGFFYPEYIQSQLLYNNGAPIYISTGAIVRSRGAVNNENSGSIQNFGNLTIDSTFTNDANASGDGIWFVSGNWINNFIFLAGSGSVFLEGNNQTIGGTSATTFYNLTLQGSGIKSLNQNINILNIIALNDRELNLDNFTLFIENSNISAITRTSGFISNNLSGRLIRRTNTASNYLFPMGSSIGIPRYRPVEITPISNNNNKYSTGFFNHSASNDGYDLNLIDTNICTLNNLFYHNIGRDSGSTNVQIKLFYDSLLDGQYTNVANWQNNLPNLWTKTNNTSYIYSFPFSEITINQWNFNNSNLFVLANPVNEVELGNNVISCFGDTVILNTTNQYSSYLWSTGASTPTINVIQSGTYYVTVTSNNCTSTDSVNVILNPLPIANAGNDTSVCSGSSVQLNATGGTTYLWSTGDSTSTINVSNGGTYNVTVTQNNCSSTDSVNVILNPFPIANAGNDTSVCSGSSVQLNATGGTTYLWSTGAGTSTINVSNGGTYNVTVTQNNCSSIDSVNVSVTPLPPANAGQNVSVCNGSSVQLNASGGISYNWLITNGLDNPNINNPTANPANTTLYIVEVSDGQCLNTDSVLVTVLSLPSVNAGNDTTIYENTVFQLNPIVNNYNTAIWSPATGLSNANILNPTVTISNQTTYTITITDNNNCSNSDAITLTTISKSYSEIVIHNTFTPNGDGVNDIWFIENLSQYPDNHLSIYNRNGHVVYEKQGYNNDWDGKYFGNNLPEATYYYVLTITGVDSFKGDVTIIR